MATAIILHKLNRYQRFEKAVGEVAQNWRDDGELEGKPGTRAVHIAMSRLAIVRAIETGADLPADWAEQGSVAHDGLRVMSLHCHYAALAAGCQGRSIEDLEAALRHPDSFEPLRQITRLNHEIAGRVETEHGLNRSEYDDGIVLIGADRYSLEGGVIRMPLLSFEIVRQLAIGEPRRDGHGCRAAATLEDMRQHIIDICLADKRLAAASLVQAAQLLKA